LTPPVKTLYFAPMSMPGISQEVRILGEAVDDLIARRGKGRGGYSRPSDARSISPSADLSPDVLAGGKSPDVLAGGKSPDVLAGGKSPDASAGGAAPEGAAKAEAADLVRRAITRLRELV
jgi:hypothetical protein